MALLTPSPFKRRIFFLVGDACCFALSLLGAYQLRFDFTFPAVYHRQYFFLLALFVVVKSTAFAVFRLHDVTWRFVGMHEIWNIARAMLMSLVVSSAILLFLRHKPLLEPLPRSVLILDHVLSLVFTVLVRGAKRLYLEKLHRQRLPKRTTAIIIGAGQAGEMLARDLLRRQGEHLFHISGFFDDDPRKTGSYIHGIKVQGSIAAIAAFVDHQPVGTAIIAIPSATAETVRRIVRVLKEANVDDIKVLPSIIDNSRVATPTVQDLQSLRIEDLLRRDVVSIDYRAIGTYVDNMCVMVTGAAGSIGSEIVRQLLQFHPAHLVLYEIDETELYQLEQKLRRVSAARITPVVGDIRDEGKLDRVFARYRPHLVFHAAACKQVPIMEDNVDEAIKTNVFGTYHLARAARAHGVRKFILISTDKAVSPSSVMGATKRLAENICTGFNQEGDSGTQFLAVRFGNVLGSRGGVLQTFIEQLNEGGPLTVTHPEMRRYFMTISEAVSLVFQAGALARGGEVFVLDMGAPLSIVTLAEEVIRLNGREPYRDVEISFIGIRPGEKLFEQLLTAEEGTRATRHRKIYTANLNITYQPRDIDRLVAHLQAEIETGGIDNEALRRVLRHYVPTYRPATVVSFPVAQDRPPSHNSVRATR